MMRRLVFVFAMVALAICALCFFGIWIPNQPSKQKYPIRGIDVSHHQGSVNWSQVRAGGIRFAYIKATEGADFRDAKFADHWRESGAAGIIHGAYHFFTLGTSGQSQAANFIAQVPADETALAPAIDLEFSGYNRDRRPSVDDFQRELSAFWDAIVEHYGKVPVVYTASDFQKQYLRAMPIERLWIREVIFVPASGWTLWQFTPRGRVSGVQGFVDLNVFRGGDVEFEKITRREARTSESSR
jgi:lysozyme